jgi:hypothetical protein
MEGAVNRTTRTSLALAVLAVVALASLGGAATASATTAPAIESESVSAISEHDATLEAVINPNGLPTSYQMRLESGCLPPMECAWITTYPLPSGELPASSEPQRVSLDLNSAGVTLHPGTRYRFSLEATNSAGTATGEAPIFTTPPAWNTPSIEAESVSHITPTDATLEAQIDTEGLETTYYFFFQKIAACTDAGPPCLIQYLPAALPSGKLLGSFVGQRVSLDLNSAGVTLKPGAEYRYLVAATNSAGTSEGQLLDFTTPSEPPRPNAQTSGTGGQSPTVKSSAPTSSHHRRHHHRHKRGLHRSNL